MNSVRYSFSSYRVKCPGHFCRTAGCFGCSLGSGRRLPAKKDILDPPVAHGLLVLQKRQPVRFNGAYLSSPFSITFLSSFSKTTISRTRPCMPFWPSTSTEKSAVRLKKISGQSAKLPQNIRNIRSSKSKSWSSMPMVGLSSRTGPRPVPLLLPANVSNRSLKLWIYRSEFFMLTELLLPSTQHSRPLRRGNAPPT